MDGILTQDELNNLLGIDDHPDRDPMNHKPTHKVVRLCEFMRPNVVERQQFKDIPYFSIDARITLNPLTVDITETHDSEMVSYPFCYKDNGRIYKDDSAWEIRVGSDVYYVIVFGMEDSPYGLFGRLGSWTPYQTVLYGKDKQAISEHSEINCMDHVRTHRCMTAESMIRHLTVWGMIDSCYKSEIIHLNEEIKNCYKTMFEVRDRLLELYGKRETVDPQNEVMLYNINKFTYEEYIENNGDLNGQ